MKVKFNTDSFNFAPPRDAMQLSPNKAISTIELDKVQDLIRSECFSQQAKRQCDQILPWTDVDLIRMHLARVQDAQKLLSEKQSPVHGDIAPLEEILEKLAVDGFVLSGEEINAIRSVLRHTDYVLEFFTGDVSKSYEHLDSIVQGLVDTHELLESIDAVLTDEGEVKDDASDELVRLARQIRSKRQEADRTFQKVVRKYSDQGWLASNLESVRNSRRVLAVEAEYKRKIRGIIHDQSATGKTAFVEPEEVIDVNNDLFELQADFRAEQRRILAELCDLLRTRIPDIGLNESILVQLDLIFGKARFSNRIDATVPHLEESPMLTMRQARHPLLFLKNKTTDQETVPFTLELEKPNRMLLVSGPNAGGKSILMKSVGLLQVMLQSGLPVSAHPESRFGIFKKLFVELGDQQSIENDLSTYSSRLLDMKNFLAGADDHSLVLMDEFGSGTDPKVGGSIAEGILDAFIDKNSFGVLTTHYSELKLYAFDKEGVVNGAMIFDQETMLPSYELEIGKPGSSFAFEIAERIGLPGKVLKYARKRVGEGTRALEDLLKDLEVKKSALQSRLRSVEEKERQLDRLTESYSKMQTELTAQRKRMRLEQKERDYQHLSQLNRELEKGIRQAMEKEKVRESKELLSKVKEAKEESRKSIVQMSDELTEQLVGKRKKKLEVGDFVRLPNGTQTGTIERLGKKKATVIVGQLRMDVPIKNLIPAKDPIEINATPSVQSDLVSDRAHFDPLLDLRGMRAKEAENILERFLDSALVSGVSFLRIVHGKGSGALKRLVSEKLKEYPVAGTAHPEDPQGGSGVTIVEL